MLYINKVIQNAIRFKKRKDAETGVNIVVGLKLVKIADFAHAIDFLKKYRNLDTKIGTTLAFCYYALSLKDIKKNDTAFEIQRPGEMELLARETMLSLARNPAPLNKVKQLEMDDPSFLEKIFWQMIFLAIEWFPSERWFIEAGLENAARSHDTEMRKVLLDISSERFYNDIQFLRVMFYHYLDKRDAGGAAGVPEPSYPAISQRSRTDLPRSQILSPDEKKEHVSQFQKAGKLQGNAGSHCVSF